MTARGRALQGRPPGGPVSVADVLDSATDGWDALTVRPPGGHVLQGVAWAEHRRARGWRPAFVRFSDGRAALVLTRSQPPLPGFLAYAPRGPIAAGDPAERVAERAIALARWLRPAGATVLVVDPELDAAPGYEAAMAAAGFRPTEGIQPSRHRLVLALPAGSSEDELYRRVAKSTRQRIGAARKAGISVGEDASGEHLGGFGELVTATAERKRFTFSAELGFVDWWRRVVAAGQARFFVAHRGERLMGGIVVYLQGGHYATAFSADRAEERQQVPGVLHLLRWEVIRSALADGCRSVDLGGVDVKGARGQPRPGDPTWGMYQHKVSFGARWVDSAPAHEVAFRPGLHRLGNLLASARRSALAITRR